MCSWPCPQYVQQSHTVSNWLGFQCCNHQQRVYQGKIKYSSFFFGFLTSSSHNVIIYIILFLTGWEFRQFQENKTFHFIFLPTILMGLQIWCRSPDWLWQGNGQCMWPLYKAWKFSLKLYGRTHFICIDLTKTTTAKKLKKVILKFWQVWQDTDHLLWLHARVKKRRLWMVLSEKARTIPIRTG